MLVLSIFGASKMVPPMPCQKTARKCNDLVQNKALFEACQNQENNLIGSLAALTLLALLAFKCWFWIFLELPKWSPPVRTLSRLLGHLPALGRGGVASSP